MANLKITTDDKGIVFDNGATIKRRGLNSVSYEFVNQDTVTFLNVYDKETIDAARLINLTLNGETLTIANYDEKLKAALFVKGNDGGVTLPIEIADVNGLEDTLTDKADLVNGVVPASQLPSYVDDVVEGRLTSDTEFIDLNGDAVTPETGKIYVDTTTNKSYRWSGSAYVALDSGIALGETANTAYRGDRGKTAYDHSQTTGNPHNTTKANIGLGNVDNTSDLNKPVSTATQQAIKDTIDKIVVGRNYILGTVNPVIMDGLNIVNQYKLAYGVLNGSLKNAGLSGKTLVVKAKYEVTGANKNCRFYIQGTNPFPNYGSLVVTEANAIGEFKSSYIVVPDKEASANISIRVDNLAIGSTLKVYDLIISDGNINIEYIPAPEDKKNVTFYNTSEQWTGDYWIDGKKIYQKTISVGALVDTGVKKATHGITSLMKILDMRGICWNPTSYLALPINYGSINTGGVVQGIRCYIDGTNVNIETGNNRTGFTESYVTLYYTCTDR